MNTPNRPLIVLIAALSADDRRIIGNDLKLLWKLPLDIARFKGKTTRHCIIMGRKTLDSLPPRWKPLPQRHNIVVSRNDAFIPENGIIVKHSVADALNYAHTHCPTDMNPDRIYVIGGGEIYREALPYADILELTLVDDPRAQGNIHFPDYISEGFTVDATGPEVHRELDQTSGREISFVFRSLTRDPDHPKKHLAL